MEVYIVKKNVIMLCSDELAKRCNVAIIMGEHKKAMTKEHQKK